MANAHLAERPGFNNDHVLSTGDLDLPDEILDPWLSKIADGSVIASLSAPAPMKFGKGKTFSFDTGEAEFVGEGEPKSGSGITDSSVTTAPYKFQKTVRWTNEVLWADEDEKTRVVGEVLKLIQPALSRALDFGIIHGVNPHTGLVANAMSAAHLSLAPNEVALEDYALAYMALDEADGIVLANRYAPSGAALDFKLASQFARMRSSEDGLFGPKLYPNLSFAGVSELEGHRTTISRTVSGVGVVGADREGTDIVGLVGNFDTVRWGIQRTLGLELIEHGDPDGAGDLKRYNEVAFRMEVVYGWGIADLGAIAKITSEPADDEG